VTSVNLFAFAKFKRLFNSPGWSYTGQTLQLLLPISTFCFLVRSK